MLIVRGLLKWMHGGYFLATALGGKIWKFLLAGFAMVLIPRE